MTPNPLLEPNTEQALQRVLASPPHALLLSGPAGMGKSTVANWLSEQLQVGPQTLIIEPEKGKTSIGVEAVRALEHFVSLKSTSEQPVNRLVRIDDAHLLTPEAQNAMLKTLEEPPVGTLLLFTSSQQEALLSTVRSRMQVLEVQKPSTDQLKAGLPAGSDKDRIIALSGGLPGLAFALANDDTSHPLVAAAKQARELLQATSFERVCAVDALAKSKGATTDLLYILMQMAHAALLTGRGAERWKQVLQVSYDAETELRSGVQPKLALTKLMLSL